MDEGFLNLFISLPDDLQYLILEYLDFEQLYQFLSYECFRNRLISHEDSRAYTNSYKRTKEKVSKYENVLINGFFPFFRTVLSYAITINFMPLILKAVKEEPHVINSEDLTMATEKHRLDLFKLIYKNLSIDFRMKYLSSSAISKEIRNSNFEIPHYIITQGYSLDFYPHEERKYLAWKKENNLQ